MNLEKVLIFLMSISLHFGGKNNIKHMKYIFREIHNVYLDFEIDLSDEFLAENGINPYDDLEITQFIKENHDLLKKDFTEWWVSAQNQDAQIKIGKKDGGDSEDNIEWII